MLGLKLNHVSKRGQPTEGFLFFIFMATSYSNWQHQTLAQHCRPVLLAFSKYDNHTNTQSRYIFSCDEITNSYLFRTEVLLYIPSSRQFIRKQIHTCLQWDTHSYTNSMRSLYCHPNIGVRNLHHCRQSELHFVNATEHALITGCVKLRHPVVWQGS